ncbi:hypothetical protein C8R43DRAFT_1126387 [Mycena crocata]|nr:hypothetical protein C8R43DRAFT_1126387 [Mycena crocata]
MTARVSLLETTLALGDLPFLIQFFQYWEPSDIFALSVLNFRLLNIVRFYQSMVWSVPRFLIRWFPRWERALELLRNGPALICGPAVAEFFDRSIVSTGTLDICVGYGGLLEVGKCLADCGYTFRPTAESRVRYFELVALTEAALFPDGLLDVSGDRSATQGDHGSRVFRFVKFERRSPLSIIMVHLVRCELHRHIFSMHSTSLMNFISATHAVALFPRSAFVKRKSFVSCQERTQATDETIEREAVWLNSYTGPFGRLERIGAVTRLDPDAEVGPRWVGDAQCWVVPCERSGEPLELLNPVAGPAFDVLDWKSGVTRHGSYLRIGEPFIWRAWSTTRGFLGA